MNEYIPKVKIKRDKGINGSMKKANKNGLATHIQTYPTPFKSGCEVQRPRAARSIDRHSLNEQNTENNAIKSSVSGVESREPSGLSTYLLSVLTFLSQISF
jgi:hypothetical protein